MTFVGILDRFFGKENNVSFKKNLRNVLGFTPGKLPLYKAALTHRSVRDNADENNERLEYLGDAILSGIVADFLFKKYPYKEEGFLTEMRSKMVNRNKLNEIAIKMGLKKITFYNKFDNSLKMSQIFGNTLEAVVGAIYLDKGYIRTKKFVIDKLIQPYFDLDVVIQTNSNHKSKIIEWTQRQNKTVRFELQDVKKSRNQKEFAIQIFIDDKEYATGFGYTKKKAEQDAALKTCTLLNIV